MRSLPALVVALSLVLCWNAAAQTQARAAAQNAAPPAPIPNRITAGIDEQRLTSLPVARHPLATAANDRGAIADGTALGRVHLVLKRSAEQEASLRSLIADLHAPGSPRYHKWLTPAEFGSRFGPSEADAAAVQGWLAGHGFGNVHLLPGRQVIEFSGTAGQFRDAFHSEIHGYAVNGQTRFANAATPKVPEALSPVIGGFSSLNNFRPRPQSHVLGSARYDRRTDRATPQWTVGIANVLAPGDFSVQYDLNPLYTGGINGNGQAIAVINESNIDIALVNRFRTVFGLPPNPPQVIVDGNDPGIDGINNPDPNFASTEAYLDVEWAGAVAPNATIELVIAADTTLESGLFLAAEYAVNNNLAPVMSLSFGECELFEGASNAYLNGLWEQAAAQGITVVVSAGDAGSAVCDNFDTQAFAVDGQAVNAMASTPWNVAVGGTDYYYSDWSTGGSALNQQIASYWNETSTQSPAVSQLGVIPEQPWNSSQYGLNVTPPTPPSTNIVAGSGGASNSALCSTGSFDNNGNCTGSLAGYPKPAWQAGNGVPNDGVRDLPDVSLFAATGWNFSFYVICATDGDCQPASDNETVQVTGIGGTSAAAPAFAGMMALINQQYGPQGQADTILYPLAAQVPAAFHDIAVGTNSVPCNISAVTTTTGTIQPDDCIAVTNPLTGDDPFYGQSVEGQIGDTKTNTAEYNAGAGYDLATGLGSIDAYQLVTNWGKVKNAATTTTLTASPLTLTHGEAVTISGQVSAASGTPTGDVALMTGSPLPGKQSGTLFSLTAGAYSGTVSYLPGGSYTIWGQYGGDATDSPSTSGGVQVNVSAEASTLAVHIFANTNPADLSKPFPYGTLVALSAAPMPKSRSLTYCNPGANDGCASLQFPTGTVTFYDKGNAIGTVPLDGKGQAQLTPTVALGVGSHSVTAAYSGDASYKASSATAMMFTVAQDTPSVQIGTVNAGSTFPQGEGPTISVLVQSGQPAGNAPLGTVTLSGDLPPGMAATRSLSPAIDPITRSSMGTVLFQVPANAPAHTYSITANYAPDAASAASYAGSSSSALQLTIEGPSGLVPTTISATASAAKTSPAQLVTVAGTVTSQSGSAPSGEVFLYVSAGIPGTGATLPVPVGVAVLNPGSGLSSTFSYLFGSQFLFQGTEQIILQYLSDGTNQSSETSISINNPLSDFTLIPEGAVVPISAGVNATDTIDLVSTNGFTGIVSLACMTPAGLGCSLMPATQPLAAGVRAPIKLTINDVSSVPGQTCNVVITGTDASGALVHTTAVRVFNCAVVAAGKVTPGVGINLPESTISVFDLLQVVITVNGGSGNPLPTGTVTLSGGGWSSAPQALSNGSVTITVPAGVLAPGTDTLTGVYVPDLTGSAAYNQSSGSAQITVINPPQVQPGVHVDVSSNNITVAQPLTVTATVSGPTAFYPTPTGSVLLSGGGYSSTATPLQGGAATFNIAAGLLQPGGDTLTVSYTPDAASKASFEANTGESFVTVSATGTPGFSLSQSGSITVSAGATTNNTATITVTPSNGFTGAITLSCQVSSTTVANANDPPQCNVPASVTISNAAPAAATLTVTTTGNTAAANVPLRRPFRGGFLPGLGLAPGGLVLGVVVLVGAPRRKMRGTGRKGRTPSPTTWLRLSALLLVAVSFAGLGCGGSGSSMGTGGGGTGTTPGAYTVTITATPGSGQPQSISVPLTVN